MAQGTAVPSIDERPGVDRAAAACAAHQSSSVLGARARSAVRRALEATSAFWPLDHCARPEAEIAAPATRSDRSRAPRSQSAIAAEMPTESLNFGKLLSAQLFIILNWRLRFHPASL